MTKVVNLYRENYDVYIGRGSIWGNPYSYKKGTKAKYLVEDRDEAIERYKHYLVDCLENGTIEMDSLRALKGLTLGCFCKPKACHGDFICELIDNME